MVDKQCYLLCYAYCVGILWETGGLGLVGCVIGCAIACNSETLSSSNGGLIGGGFNTQTIDPTDSQLGGSELGEPQQYSPLREE